MAYPPTRWCINNIILNFCFRFNNVKVIILRIELYLKKKETKTYTIDLMRTNHLDETSLKDFRWTQMSGYGYGLGVRTMIDKAKGGSLSPVGEFGWAGDAGAYVMIDLDNEVAVFYIQHMLNSQEPFIHPRLRNIVYSCLTRD
jgi:CubicO group peptidase (beta-lactamase class C family)